MRDRDIQDAADGASGYLSECGWEVEEVLLLAAVLHPDDDSFSYTLNSYPDPEKLDPGVRSRIFDSLVSTAEKFADPDKIAEAIQTFRDGEEVDD